MAIDHWDPWSPRQEKRSDAASFWDPWRELERLQRQVARAFRGLHAAQHGDFPPLNVWTNEEGVVLTAALPGMDTARLEISVLGDTLTLKGRRDEPKAGEGNVFHRRERGSGGFSRTVQLPFRIKSDGVNATYRCGVLEIVVPRVSDEKAESIRITKA